MAPVRISRAAYPKTKLSDENFERIIARSLLLPGRPILSGLERLLPHFVGATVGPRLRSRPGQVELPPLTMLKRGHGAVPDSRQRPKLTQSTTLAIDTLACVCSCPVLGPIHEWRLHSKLGRQPSHTLGPLS